MSKTERKKYALEELYEIRDQLHELSDEAHELIKNNFPDRAEGLRAYEALSFGWSDNPNNKTFERELDLMEDELS